MTVKISDILHRAADVYLAATYDNYFYHGRNQYSCCAISQAAHAMYHDFQLANEATDRIYKGLRALGLNVSSSTAFDKFIKTRGFSPEKQQARYAWLKFVALLAEEQGV